MSETKNAIIWSFYVNFKIPFFGFSCKIAYDSNNAEKRAAVAEIAERF